MPHSHKALLRRNRESAGLYCGRAKAKKEILAKAD